MGLGIALYARRSSALACLPTSMLLSRNGENHPLQAARARAGGG